MDQSFGECDQPEGHRWGGGRQILHAALIFDPDFIPPPINYQLPKRPRPSQKEACNGYAAAINKEDLNGDIGRSERTAETPADDTQGTPLIHQIHLPGTSTHEATPSDQLRWNALPYRHDMVLDGNEIVHHFPIESHMRNRANDKGETLAFLHITPYHSDDDSLDDVSASFSVINDGQDRQINGRFAVTAEEFELLDYEGTRGRRGNDALYACTRRAASVGPEQCSDADFRLGSRMRWSL